MSGVTGAERVRSRADFDQFVEEYKSLISKFPGVKSVTPSGSYNSDPFKQDFGDIDLIIHISDSNTKAAIKYHLVNFLIAQPENVIVPFTSEKYAGKRTNNAGELVSVRFYSKTLGYSVQIDNIVALSAEEADFKRQFLDMPAEKQGLILGLVKVAAIETGLLYLLYRMSVSEDIITGRNRSLPTEDEFSLSSSKLELRMVWLKTDTGKVLAHDILWTSQNWDHVKKLLWQYDLDKPFNELLIDVKNTITNPRSARRIMGLFKSMVSVKSGEVGTPKGKAKEQALVQVALCLAQ